MYAIVPLWQSKTLVLRSKHQFFKLHGRFPTFMVKTNQADYEFLSEFPRQHRRLRMGTQKSAWCVLSISHPNHRNGFETANKRAAVFPEYRTKKWIKTKGVSHTRVTFQEIFNQKKGTNFSSRKEGCVLCGYLRTRECTQKCTIHAWNVQSYTGSQNNRYCINNHLTQNCTNNIVSRH